MCECESVCECENVCVCVCVFVCTHAEDERGVEDQTIDTSTHLQSLLIHGQRSRLITDLFFKSRIIHTPRQVQILK